MGSTTLVVGTVAPLDAKVPESVPTDWTAGKPATGPRFQPM